MRSSPSIVGTDRDIYLVLELIMPGNRRGAYRPRHLAAPSDGWQYHDPVRFVSFNPSEGWSQDALGYLQWPT